MTIIMNLCTVLLHNEKPSAVWRKLANEHNFNIYEILSILYLSHYVTILLVPIMHLMR